MDRRAFIGKTSLLAIGSLFLVNSSIALIPSKLKVSAFNRLPFQESRILIPFCPGKPIKGKVGVVLQSKNPVSEALMYKHWYGDIVCFTNGKSISNDNLLQLNMKGIVVNTGCFTQINELPDSISINTTSGTEKLEVLYWDYLKEESNADLFS